jgi:hypothetical protein
MQPTSQRPEQHQERSFPLAAAEREAIDLELLVTDPEVCAELACRAEGRERDEFALTALRIGVMAIRQAQGRVDADVVRHEGDRLIAELNQFLKSHQTSVNENVAASLRSYFDPESGRFSERVERLVRNGGELEQVLKRQIGTSDSELAKTLAAHVGENSALMKLLDPEASNGLISALTTTTEETLKAQRDQILREFSLDNKEGALNRLIQELKQKQGEAGEQLEKRIDAVVSEFSLDREDSALSRLVGRVETAQKLITSEFSLDRDDSALARLRKELVHRAEKDQKSREDFYREVTTALAEMTARKEESRRGTQHGLEFEDALFEQVRKLSANTDDVVTATGATTGMIRHCKVGDIVIEIGPEHIASGCRIVLEAKQSQDYDVRSALEEIDTARKNRDAQIGLFVFSAQSAPAGVESLARYGNDLVLVWDAEDPASDVVLKAALSLARALCTTARDNTDAIDIDLDALVAAMRAVEKQIEGFDAIQKSAETILSSGEKIKDRARIMRNALNKEVDVLNAAVDDVRELVHRQKH